MRRLVLVFMLCLLPLQWSWAMAASLCAHEAGGAAHFGHHEHCGGHQHAQDDEGDAGSPATKLPSDCGTCHGVANACPAVVAALQHLPPSGTVLPSYAGHLPEPPVESFLRPPLV